MDPPLSSDAIRPDAAAGKEAFKLLSDETRLGVLQTLWEVQHPSDPTPMRFSELRERLDVDDPGRLNYHLDKLRETFIRRTDAGYELRESGKRIVRVLVSGTAVSDPEIAPVEVDVDCWYCGGQPEWSYRDGCRYLECTACDARCVESFSPGVISKTEFPPSGLLDRTPNEINDADRIWSAHRRASVMDGVCPECAGEMPVAAVDVCADHDPDWEDFQYCGACGSIFEMLVTHVCESCRYRWRLPTRFYPSRHPAVTAFYYEHGVDFDLAWFEQRELLLAYEQEVVSDDPLRIAITIPLEGDELRLTFDDAMDVVDVEQ
jgi:DNA-binding transcriptional ArsR family regulator